MNNKDAIKQILQEGKREITKISIFDFDGTLVDTPMLDTHKDVYQQKTGREWPHKGWWGKADSLDMEIFDMPVMASVIADYKAEKPSPNTLMVMLTGRIKPLAPYVEKILAAKGLSFDKYIYNNGSNTLTSKIASLDELLKEFPSVTDITMWEDRAPHIVSFRAYGDTLVKNGRLLNFTVIQVEGNHHT
jgi:hypothetical protein